MPAPRRATTLKLIGWGLLLVSLIYTVWQFAFLRAKYRDDAPSDTTNDNQIRQTPSSEYSRQRFHACRDEDNELQFFATAPHAVIIGALKSGTRSLFHYVRYHPDLLASGQSEAHFFDRDPQWLHREHEADTNALSNATLCGLRHYYASKYFSQTRLQEKTMVAIEKTPDYLFHVDTARHLKLMTEPWKSHVLVLLRDPVQRAWAQWKMNWEKEYEHRSFETVLEEELAWLKRQGWSLAPSLVNYSATEDSFALPSPLPVVQSDAPFSFHRGNYLARGMYALQLQEWIPHFDNDRIIVLLQEEMMADANAVFAQLCDRLGVQHYKLADTVIDMSYSHAIRRKFHGKLSETTEDYLRQFFAPYNHLLGEQFPSLQLHRYWLS